MGHGIAQVFAGAGHDVAFSMPSVRPRHAAPAHREEPRRSRHGGWRGRAGVGVLRSRRGGAGRGRRHRSGAGEARAQAGDLRRPRAAGETGRAACVEHIGHPDRRYRRGLGSGERILGTHWWNPPFLVPLVEVVGTPATAAQAISTMIDLLGSVGKTPVQVKRDVAGFVGNRLQHALWREAIAIVAEGIADAETVDTDREGQLRPPPRRARPARERRPRRHRSDPRYPQRRATASRPLARSLALSRQAGRGGTARNEDGARLSCMDTEIEAADLRAAVFNHLKSFPPSQKGSPQDRN